MFFKIVFVLKNKKNKEKKRRTCLIYKFRLLRETQKIQKTLISNNKNSFQKTEKMMFSSFKNCFQE